MPGVLVVGVCTAWMGLEPTVFISDYDILRQAYGTDGELLSDRPTMPLMDMFIKGQYGLAFISGERWREQRRFALRVLRDFGFGISMLQRR